MPKNKEAIIRYNIIDKCLIDKHKPYPNMLDLIKSCRETLGKDFSESTIQKDLKTMKEDEGLGYFAPIVYSRRHQGYYYSDENYSINKLPLSDEEVESLFFAVNVLEQFKGSRVGDSFNNAVEKVMTTIKYNLDKKERHNFPMVITEVCPFFKGYELIDEIIVYIKNKQVIAFQHYSYDTCSTKEVILHPYLLKEHRNRWYLVGFSEFHKNIRIFGLDRITEIKKADVKYNIPNFDPLEFFKHAIGVYIKQDKQIVEVELQFDKMWSKYLEAQPLHQTQIIVSEIDGNLTIRIQVYPTAELMQLLMSYGKGLTVLSPRWLIEEIKKEYENALKNYEKK